MRDLDRYRGCLLGLAAGDALGTTLEFSRPDVRADRPTWSAAGRSASSRASGPTTRRWRSAWPRASSSAGGFDPVDQLGATSAGGDGLPEQHRPVLRHRQHRAHALRASSETGEPFGGSTDPSRPATAPSCGWPPCRCSTPLTTLERSRRGRELADDARRGRMHRGVPPPRRDAVPGDGGHRQGDDPPGPRRHSRPASQAIPGAITGRKGRGRAGLRVRVRSLEAALWCFWRRDFEAASCSPPISGTTPNDGRRVRPDRRRVPRRTRYPGGVAGEAGAARRDHRSRRCLARGRSSIAPAPA